MVIVAGHITVDPEQRESDLLQHPRATTDEIGAARSDRTTRP